MRHSFFYTLILLITISCGEKYSETKFNELDVMLTTSIQNNEWDKLFNKIRELGYLGWVPNTEFRQSREKIVVKIANPVINTTNNNNNLFHNQAITLYIKISSNLSISVSLPSDDKTQQVHIKFPGTKT